MTPNRARAALLIASTMALASLVTACSSTDGPHTNLPDTGTQAPNSPPGSIPDRNPLPMGALPQPSGDPSACAGAPFDLTVRTSTGEERTISGRSAWAMYVAGAPNWLIVAGDLDLPADQVRSNLPDPAGQPLVVLRVSATTPTTQTIDLAAGDRFEPSGASGPTGQPVVDAQVRTAAGQTPSTGALTGSLAVDAVTSEGVCLTVDLQRDGATAVKGRIVAPFLSVNQSVFSS